MLRKEYAGVRGSISNAGFLSLLIGSILLFTVPLQADRATTNVPAGNSPYAVAVNPITNKIYVANDGDKTVTVIDGATNDTTIVPAGNSPEAVAVNPNTNKIYVANYYGNTVTVIDGATNDTTIVPTGDNPQAIAVNPITNKIYVANYSDSSVTVIDGATNTTTTVPAGDSPNAVAVNPNTNKIYVVNKDDYNVTVIDGATNDTTIVATENNPDAVAVNPNTNKIYVTNFWSSSVTVIDGATNDTTIVSTGPHPYKVAINPNTNKIYVSNYSDNTVTVIDGATNDTTIVPAGDSPWVVAVNPNTNKIYVANVGDNTVTVIDGATNDTTIVPTGSSPYAVGVNPNTNKIYVPNEGDNTVTVIDGATNTTTTVSAGSDPYAVAVNPNTNRIYVPNYGDNTVTVIDGATNDTTIVPTGSSPYAVAVNPITNKIYVPNYGDNTVTVIDGATNDTTIVPAGDSPDAVAVNPNTNKIYVANYGDNIVTVIDGATNDTTIVPSGSHPDAVAVNPITNKIYVANEGVNIVTVIDGATNDTTIVPAVSYAYAVAVNPNTNKIYVPNEGDDNVTVIDGATNDTTIVPAGDGPWAVAVNPNTNKIYVPNHNDNTVTVIDGATNTTTTVPSGKFSCAVAVNPNTNKIYVANYGDNTVTVVDGATNDTTIVPTGDSPRSVAVNPITNKIYVANYGGNTVTVIDEVKTYDSPLASSITPLSGNITDTPLPAFTGNSIDSRSPHNSTIMKVLYKFDTTQKPWQEALITSGVGTAGVSWQAQPNSPLTTGFHTLYVVALDMTSATINKTEGFAGSITPYYFFVSSPYADIHETNISGSYTPTDPWRSGGNVSLSFTVRNTGEKVMSNIRVSSTDLTSGINHIYGNNITFNPSIISELQPGYTQNVTATIPVSIGQGAGTYTGRFCISPAKSSPDYVNVSVFVDTLRDLDVQDYGASLVGNTMHLVGVANSVVLGKFNLSAPNSKEDNFDGFDGPGNTDISNITYIPDTLFAYGKVDTILPSNISMVDSVVDLGSGGGYQCLVQVSIPSGKTSGRDFVGNFTSQAGLIQDEFKLDVTVADSGGSAVVASAYSFWGGGTNKGNYLKWTGFDMNESGYDIYRCDASDSAFSRLNTISIRDTKYLDKNVRSRKRYQYKLGVKLGDGKELLIGPISITAIGGIGFIKNFALGMCSPNPFRDKMSIRYAVPTGDRTVKIQIYDLSGRLVKTLVDGKDYPGYHTVQWNGRDNRGTEVSSGIYFCRMEAGDFTSVKKLVYFK